MIETKDYPDRVYKYRCWKNELHKRVLTHNELYLSSPKDFNDPFDCRISTNFYLLDTLEKKKAYVGAIIDKHRNDIISKGMSPDERYQDMLSRLEDTATFQLEADKMYFGFQHQVFGVLSLSELWNNVLMWSHYGDFHKGVCIGFHERKLVQTGLFGKGGKVTYGETYPEIYPELESSLDEQKAMEKFFKQSHWKAKDWEYEKEYRLMKTFPSIPTDQERIITVPDSCFSEVVLGVEFPEEDKNEIKNIAKAKGIPIYQAVKVPFKFKLDKYRLV